MTLPDDIDWPLATCYLDGTCTPIERAAFEQWLVADPARGAWLSAYRQAAAAATHSVRDASRRFNADAGFRQAQARLGLGPAVPSAQTGTGAAAAAARPEPDARHRAASSRAVQSAGTVPKSRPRRVGGGAAWSWTALFASALVALGAGAAIGVRHSAASHAREYGTAAGQRLSVTLADGTQLTLAPTSHVRVAADYGLGTRGREVELDGQAYFAVVHDTAHPFVVKTHGVVVRDVGTAFDVKAYPEDTGVRIAVADGAVCVVGGGVVPPGRTCGTQVRAGSVATVTNGAVAFEHRGDVSAYTAWMQGRLVFNGAPLSDVVRELGRTFDVEITIADSALAGHQVSGAFDNETVDQVLDDITDVIGGRYERTGRRVVIRRRPAGAMHRVPDERPTIRTAQASVPAAAEPQQMSATVLTDHEGA